MDKQVEISDENNQDQYDKNEFKELVKKTPKSKPGDLYISFDLLKGQFILEEDTRSFAKKRISSMMLNSIVFKLNKDKKLFKYYQVSPKIAKSITVASIAIGFFSFYYLIISGQEWSSIGSYRLFGGLITLLLILSGIFYLIFVKAGEWILYKREKSYSAFCVQMNKSLLHDLSLEASCGKYASFIRIRSLDPSKVLSDTVDEESNSFESSGGKIKF